MIRHICFSTLRGIARCHRVLWLVGFLPMVSALAQDPLTINGIADKTVYNLQVSFSVPSSPGYTYDVTLDDAPVPTDLTHAVTKADYHEVQVWRTNSTTGLVDNRLVRFNVRSDRGDSENGLIKWTPFPPVPSAAAELAGAQMRVITPQDYPMGLPIPVIARIEDSHDNSVRVNGFISAAGFEGQDVRVVRGVGSGFLPPAVSPGPLAYNAQLQSLQSPRQINVEAATVWTNVSGLLSSSTDWPENSRIYLSGHLMIASNISLTIGAGTIVKLNPLVNITNRGRVFIRGSVDRPVVFTATNVVWPEKVAGAWGGFLMQGSNAVLEATGAILTGGGGRTVFFPFPNSSPVQSHRGEQSVLTLHSNAQARLTNCFIINTAGQVGNGYNSDLTLDRCLFQRAITAGEYVGGTLLVARSAIIEFPSIDGVYNSTIAEADYDGIYFTTGTHILRDSLFGFAKDDAIDSGSGDAGTVLVTNCWVESALHEAHAWSGGGRVASTYDSVLINSGQGIEAGWSTGNNSPLCFADRLLTTGNSVGARFGDNYTSIGSGCNGFLRLTNSLILNNYRDIFVKHWNTSGGSANTYVDRLQQTDFRSNFITAADSRYPSNLVWNPAADGWRLTNWMSTPADAAVGVGLAIWTNQFALSNLFEGVPVRLSSFTTNFVEASYTFLNGGGGTLAVGALTFAPGETVRRIYPSGFDISAQSSVQVVLTGAGMGELTGQTNATYAGSVPSPQVSCWISTNQLPGYRMAEGVLVKLSVPSGLPVNVDYAYEAGVGTLKSGTLGFAPGETVKWVDPSGVGGYEWVRMNLVGAEGAALVGISSVTYTNPPLVVSFGTGTNQVSLATFSNGLAVVLNAPAPAGVSVSFAYEGSGQVLTNGTITFGVGQSSYLLTAPTVDASQHEVIRVSLSQAVLAALVKPDVVYYLPTRTVPAPVSVTLLPKGASWKYLDTGTNLGAAWSVSNPGGWTGTNFVDGGWASGGAPLGYDYAGVQVTQLSYGPDANNKYITYYFRTTFQVTNAASLSSLTIGLLRDDGGVVYLNGPEVYRDNMPQGTISSTTVASSTVSGTTSTYYTTNIPVSGLSQALREGTNVLAVEVHQRNLTSSDVIMDLQVVGNPAPVVVPPVPVITSPTNGQVIGSGSSLAVSVSATNAYTNMVLYADTVRVGADETWPFSFAVSGLGMGSHEFTVVGSDAAGNALASLPVTIVVVTDDTDGDGMTDAWEVAHGLNPNVNDAALDPDGDGMTNLQEYTAGTDPQDALSYLKVEAIEPAVLANGVTIQFKAVAGKTYSVLYAEVVPTNLWAKLQDIAAEATSRVVTVTNSDVTAAQRFYRLVTPAQ